MGGGDPEKAAIEAAQELGIIYTKREGRRRLDDGVYRDYMSL